MISPETSSILIVDDDRGGREALEALLLTQGYTLFLASSGQDALRKLAETPIDLVLLDIMMPGMDGYEVCRRIRSDPAMADIPVLMLTALHDYRSRLAGFEVGADDYITKPYDSAELFARVRTITRLNRYRRQVAERSKIQQLLDLSPDGQLVADAAGKILLTNRNMLELLGIPSASEIIESDLVTWIEIERRPEFASTWDEFWKRPEKAYHLETRLKRKDKAVQPVELFLWKLDFNGQAAVLLIVIDARLRLQMANDLERLQTLLTSLLEIMPEFVYCKDLESRYVLVNPAMAGLLGLNSPTDANGKTDFDFYPKELATRYASDEQHLLATGKPILGQEEPAVDARGNWLVVSTSKAVLRNKQGDPIGIIGLGKDLTTLRNAEHALGNARAERTAADRQIAELNHQLLKAEETQALLLANLGKQIAHLGQATAVEAEKPQAKAEETLAANKTSEGLLALARDLAEYTGLAKSQGVRSNTQFSLAECAQSAITQAAEGKVIEAGQVDVLLASSLPDLALGDRDGLVQVMVRLLRNVFRQLKTGHPSILIEEENYDALKRPAGFHMHVEITCQGLTMKNEDIPQAFQPYAEPFNGEGSTGLDLAICKRLVEGAGGGIWIESQEVNGKGLAFHFTYPLSVP